MPGIGDCILAGDFLAGNVVPNAALRGGNSVVRLAPPADFDAGGVGTCESLAGATWSSSRSSRSSSLAYVHDFLIGNGTRVTASHGIVCPIGVGRLPAPCPLVLQAHGPR